MLCGLDLLAGAKYKKEVVKFSGFALGIFAETFGDAFPVVEAAIKAGCKLVRVQLIWSDSHSFGDKDIPKIKKLAAKYNQLANKYPAADIRLSPFCEHNLGNPDKYLDICQLAAPSCTIVNTPWKGAFSKKYINEIHGDHAKPPGRYQYSVDGGFKNDTDVMDIDVEALKEKHKDAEILFLWSARFNLKWSMKDKTPRPQRKAFPTKDYVQSIAYLFTDKRKTSIPKKTTVKSHAENHGPDPITGKPDAKGDKLLIIYPERHDRLTLKRNGKKIGSLNYYGTFSGGGFRYYASTFGFKYGKCDVFAGSKKIAEINGGFRDGVYR